MDILFSAVEFGTDKNVGFMPLMAVELSQRGHDVAAVQSQTGETLYEIPVDVLDSFDVGPPWWARTWGFYRSFRAAVGGVLDDYDPDIVVTSTRTLVPTVQAANERDIPTVGVYVGLGTFRFAPRDLSLDKHPKLRTLPPSALVQYPFVRSVFRQHQIAIQQIDERIAVSEFIQDVLAATFDVDSTVLRTPIPATEVTAPERSRDKITMVNPRTELKGSDIVIELVRKLDDQEFLVAGTFASEANERELSSLPNVELTGWVDDMREVYARTKLLLVPSLVEEGGPRIIGEAYANGIPVVGTDRGAIPEFVGDAGKIVTSPYDIGEWKRCIDTVLSDLDIYESRATERNSEFMIEPAIDQLETVIEHVVDGATQNG